MDTHSTHSGSPFLWIKRRKNKESHWGAHTAVRQNGKCLSHQSARIAVHTDPRRPACSLSLTKTGQQCSCQTLSPFTAIPTGIGSPSRTSSSTSFSHHRGTFCLLKKELTHKKERHRQRRANVENSVKKTRVININKSLKCLPRAMMIVVQQQQHSRRPQPTASFWRTQNSG